MTLGQKKLVRKEFANSLYLSNTFLRPLFVAIREVQERVSVRIEKVPGRYVDGTLKASRVAERGRQRAIGNSVVVCVVCVHARASVCARVRAFCVCVSVQTRARARARARVCVCVCVCACVRCLVHVHTICGTSLYRPREARTVGCF